MRQARWPLVTTLFPATSRLSFSRLAASRLAASLFVKSLVAMFLVATLGLAGCAEIPQQDATGTRIESQLIPLAVMLYADRGSCLYSRREASESATLRCSRVPAATCRADGLYEPLGRLVVTSGTRSRLSSEVATLVSDHPDCSVSAAALLAQAAFTTTSESHNSDARAASFFSVVSDCSILSNSNLDKLATRTQSTLLNSARGHLARQAATLGQTACVNALYLSQTDRTLVSDAAAANVLFYTECGYGSSAGLNNCTAEEKAAAHAFDFANAL